MQMAVKVAVLGPKDLVDRIVDEGKNYKYLEMIPCPYKRETETMPILNALGNDIGLILFSGPIPYHIARKSVERDLPMLYVSYSGSAFYKVLFCCFQRLGWDSKQKLRFSLDTIHRPLAEEILRELDIADYELYTSENRTETAGDTPAQFHIRLFDEGKTDFGITCLTSAYGELQNRGIPSFRIVPTMSSIRDALNLANLEARNLIFKEAQLCVGVMRILNRREMRNYSSSEYEQKRMNLLVTELFINFSEGIKASMKTEGDDEYIFYATRGAIENVSNNYSCMPLIQDIEEHTSYKVCIGLGYGYSGNEAEKNSWEALKHAIGFKENTCFVVFEDGKIRGPLEAGRTMEYYPGSQQSGMVDLAQKSNVSIMTLNKVVSIFQSGKEIVTANDISDSLNITLRSARRILNSLEKSGIVVMAGEEQPATRGRPRQIYKLA